jgi:putative membrane protein
MLTKSNLNFLPRTLTPAQTTLLTLWVLVMISLPIVDWTFGWQVMIGAVNAGVLAQALAVAAVLWGALGAARALRMAALVAALGWAAEALGSKTGFPFGAYHYTEALQPQLFGVPLLIPLAWLMMLPPAWSVAQAVSARITPRGRTPAFIALSALAMTAWDLFLDPQMVSWGLWEWHNPGGFFGIPWSNYLGWLLVSGLITALIRPRNLPIAPLLLIYTITWLLQTVGLGVFWGMPGPAIVGGIVMGGLALWGWRAHLKGQFTAKGAK